MNPLDDLRNVSNQELEEMLFDLTEEMKDRGFEDEGRNIQSIIHCLD